MNGIVGWARPAIAALVVPIAFFALHRVTPTHSYSPSAHPAADITQPSASHHPDTDWLMPPLEDDDDVVVDLIGNEVTPAVATYTIDASGSPYEVHSPQTELPRLGSPKS